MKRHSNRHQLRLVTEISVTPFLDLVLVLLFVFLLAAPLLKAGKGLLPQASAKPVAAEVSPPDQVKLVLNRDQSVTLNGAMLARADLPASLKQWLARKPGLGVEVCIHHDLPVQQLVEVMHLLELAGIRKTAVTTHADEP